MGQSTDIVSFLSKGANRHILLVLLEPNLTMKAGGLCGTNLDDLCAYREALFASVELDRSLEGLFEKEGAQLLIVRHNL